MSRDEQDLSSVVMPSREPASSCPQSNEAESPASHIRANTEKVSLELHDRNDLARPSILRIPGKSNPAVRIILDVHKTPIEGEGTAIHRRRARRDRVCRGQKNPHPRSVNLALSQPVRGHLRKSLTTGQSNT